MRSSTSFAKREQYSALSKNIFLHPTLKVRAYSQALSDIML